MPGCAGGAKRGFVTYFDNTTSLNKVTASESFTLPEVNRLALSESGIACTVLEKSKRQKPPRKMCCGGQAPVLKKSGL